MKRRRWIIMAGLVGIAAIYVFFRHTEPSYDGQPLSFWLRGFGSASPDVHWRSGEAVRQIGTNAIPQLIAGLKSAPLNSEPWWRPRLRGLLEKQSFVKYDLPLPTDSRSEALAALDALGPMGTNAIPTLESLLLKDPPDHRALLVLARMGPAGVSALNRALTNNERVIRLSSELCLKLEREHSKVLFPDAQDDHFLRRGCQFLLLLLQASVKQYKADHAEDFMTNDLPVPSLPPGFQKRETESNRPAGAALTDKPPSSPPPDASQLE